MGLFSSKKSSSVSNQNIVDTTNINAQSSGGQVVAISGDGNTITDGGAVARALNFAEQSQTTAAALTLSLIDGYQEASKETLEKVLKETKEQSKDARDFALTAVKSETRALSEQVLIYGGVGVLALAALVIWKL